MTKLLLKAICMASEAAEPASEAIKKCGKCIIMYIKLKVVWGKDFKNQLEINV